MSNNLGEFSISDLTPGTYHLLISFVGFSPFTTDLTVAAGQTTRVEATLTVAAQNEQVIVYAERVHGEAEAINREPRLKTFCKFFQAKSSPVFRTPM